MKTPGRTQGLQPQNRVPILSVRSKELCNPTYAATAGDKLPNCGRPTLTLSQLSSLRYVGLRIAGAMAKLTSFGQNIVESAPLTRWQGEPHSHWFCRLRSC